MACWQRSADAFVSVRRRLRHPAANSQINRGQKIAAFGGRGTARPDMRSQIRAEARGSHVCTRAKLAQNALSSAPAANKAGRGTGPDAPETEVVAARADFSFAARANHIPRAIPVGAQERAAAMHALALGRFRRIEGTGGPLGVARHVEIVGERLVIIRPIPVGTP